MPSQATTFFNNWLAKSFDRPGLSINPTPNASVIDLTSEYREIIMAPKKRKGRGAKATAAQAGPAAESVTTPPAASAPAPAPAPAPGPTPRTAAAETLATLRRSSPARQVFPTRSAAQASSSQVAGEAPVPEHTTVGSFESTSNLIPEFFMELTEPVAANLRLLVALYADVKEHGGDQAIHNIATVDLGKGLTGETLNTHVEGVYRGLIKQGYMPDPNRSPTPEPPIFEPSEPGVHRGASRRRPRPQNRGAVSEEKEGGPAGQAEREPATRRQPQRSSTKRKATAQTEAEEEADPEQAESPEPEPTRKKRKTKSRWEPSPQHYPAELHSPPQTSELQQSPEFALYSPFQQLPSLASPQRQAHAFQPMDPWFASPLQQPPHFQSPPPLQYQSLSRTPHLQAPGYHEPYSAYQQYQASLASLSPYQYQTSPSMYAMGPSPASSYYTGGAGQVHGFGQVPSFASPQQQQHHFQQQQQQPQHGLRAGLGIDLLSLPVPTPSPERLERRRRGRQEPSGLGEQEGEEPEIEED